MDRIVGIWDLGRSGGSLGTLLILLEELEIQRQVHAAQGIDVAFVGDARSLVDGSVAGAACAGREARGANLDAMSAVVHAMSGVTNCHACFDAGIIGEVRDLIGSDCVAWPDPESLVAGRHNYDSTRVIREFHARTGGIPRLSVSAARLAWARGYLNAKAGSRLAVAVHLKNNPRVSGQSNADLGSWHAFIASCRRSVPAHFVLIGDDATNADFRALPNVTVARDDGIAIDGYLALIQAAGLFMGMMSGPANMALFGVKPYLIFKNPDHHAKQMVEELGDAGRYPFALADQRVLRIWDTAENLAAAFDGATHEVAA